MKKSVKDLLDRKTLSPENIAAKHKVSVSTIRKQLGMGSKVEKEHTRDSKVAREIALDHLSELPNYYTKLKRIEPPKK